MFRRAGATARLDLKKKKKAPTPRHITVAVLFEAAMTDNDVSVLGSEMVILSIGEAQSPLR